MSTTLKRIGTVAATAAMIALVGCQDSTVGPRQTGGAAAAAGLSLSYDDGNSYSASGAPSLDGLHLQSSTFAVAFPDSLGGLVMVSLQQTRGSRGDVFILQLNDARTGSFSPCGQGQTCSGRMLDDYDATQRQTLGPRWEIVSGTVQVDTAGSDRLTGSFENLVLQAQDSVRPDRTIGSGSFNLDLVTSATGKAALSCFLSGTSQSPQTSCNDPATTAESRISYSYGDGGSYDATGTPSLAGQSLADAGFSTAFEDGGGGLIISGFQEHTGTAGDVVGDLFVLHLSEARAGSRGSCGGDPSCSIQVFEDYDATQRRTGGPAWEVVSGSVQVDTIASDHTTGSFSNLVLQATDSIRSERTITSGEFNVKLISDPQVIDATSCFLSGGVSPTAGASCRVEEEQGEPELSLTFGDGRAYEARGTPILDTDSLTTASFATALPDSGRGMSLVSFQRPPRTLGDVLGDLFVLHLSEDRAGSFGPCGIGQSCSGRLLERYDATDGSPGLVWEIVGGSVEVDASSPDGVSGTVSNLLLQSKDSIGEERTISTGSFTLQPLTNSRGAHVVRCFVARATSDSC